MRFFKTSVFRLLMCGIAMILTAFLPTYLFMRFLPDLWELGVSISIVLSATILILIVIGNYFITTKPIRSIIKSSKNITKGEYVKLKNKSIDSDLNDLIVSINNTAYEFENLEQMRKSFVSNASHELRSPLTSIQGFLQAILDGTISSADQEKYLKIVYRESLRLNGLVNSMLDLSRMESGKNPLTQSRFELNTVIKHVVERFEPNLIKKECGLDVDFIREQCFVFADREKIIQVLINLIDNAIKYSPPKSKILVTTHFHGKKMYVSVKDNGFGISKKDQAHIWDRFYKVDKAHTPTKHKSTGLGLSIVKKIIDDHKEVIWVESSKGAGATFIFTLPIFDPNKHKVATVPQLSAPAQKG